jgi:hypothetical protein
MISDEHNMQQRKHINYKMLYVIIGTRYSKLY